MVKKASIKREVTLLPRNLEEAAEFLSFIGKERRKIDKIDAETNDKVEALKAKAMAEVQVHQEKIDELTEGLYIFAESRRDELTEEGKRKTVKLPTGTFGWRITPLSVRVSNTKMALASCKMLGLQRFIRIKTIEEVNKEAILRERELADGVKGLSISQREEFVVKPTEIEVEIISDIKKLKKKIE